MKTYQVMTNIPFFEGMNAAVYGRVINPYPHNSKSAEDWLQGYRGLIACAQEIESETLKGSTS